MFLLVTPIENNFKIYLLNFKNPFYCPTDICINLEVFNS